MAGKNVKDQIRPWTPSKEADKYTEVWLNWFNFGSEAYVGFQAEQWHFVGEG